MSVQELMTISYQLSSSEVTLLLKVYPQLVL